MPSIIDNMEDFKAIQDLPKVTNELFVKAFREQVYDIMKKAGIYNPIFVGFMNEYFNELEKRLDIKNFYQKKDE